MAERWSKERRIEHTRQILLDAAEEVFGADSAYLVEVECSVGNESFAHDGRFHACGGGGRVFGSLCRHGVEVYTECLYTSHAVGQVDVEQDSAEVEYDVLNHDCLVVFDVYVHLREWNFDA
jgi:hypothetical protein